MKLNKKLMAIVFLTILSVVCALFVSCDSQEQPLTPEEQLEKMNDKEKSEYLSQKSDEYYKDGLVAIYTASADVSGTAADTKYQGEISVSGEKTLLFPDTENLSAFEKTVTETSISIGTQKTTSTVTEIEGFINGNEMIYAYVPDKSSNTSAKYLKCACTPAEYTNIMNARTMDDMGDISDLDFDDMCKNVSVKKSEDSKSWVITYSEVGSDSEFVKEFAKSLGASMGSLPCDISVNSINVVLTVDSETYALKDTVADIEVGMKGDTVDLKMDFAMSFSFSKAEADTDLVPANYDRYFDTPALLYKDLVISAYKKAVNADSVQATLKVNVTAEYRYRYNNYYTDVTSTYRETDKINYGYLNGKYCYGINSKINNNGSQSEIQISYDGKEETVTVGRETETNKKTESQAKAYISSLVQQYYIEDSQIRDMSLVKFKDGTITVTFELYPSDKAKSLLSGLSDDFYSINNFDERLVIRTDKDLNLDYVLYAVSGKHGTDSYSYESTLSQFGEADLSGIEIPETVLSAK